MKYPEFIKENGCIGVPAPSAGATNSQYENKMIYAKKFFESMNYKITLSENLLKVEGKRGRSASGEKRANEFNNMIENKDIDMILCACGGDFLIEMLPYVDFDLIKSNPKFVAGFSDPTGLLYPITTKYDVATIYGQNFGSFGTEELHQGHLDFLELIEGNLLEEKSYELYEEKPLERITGLEKDNLTEKVYWNTLNGNPVSIKGRIIGGCFDVIAELAGTKYDGINDFNKKYKDDGIIWFFDNCEYSMEETIRTLWKMNELGYFKHAKGVIFGRFGVNNTCYEYDTKTCLEDSVLKELKIPIIYDADISHKAPCLTIINGAIATISVREGKGKISFDLK